MKKVENYYDEIVQHEWNRMDRHPIEFAITKKALDEYILPNSKILDNGSGPGRYSIYLAQKGYQVSLLDLSSKNVELASQKAEEFKVSIEEFIHGNAMDLSRFDDETFDSVLVMGPLYHLTDEEDRKKVIAESLRVLKPGGKIFVSFISRYAPIIDSLGKFPEEIGESYLTFKKYLVDGINKEGSGFTVAYFAHPNEIEPFMKSFGLETLRIFGVEPFVLINELQVNKLSQEQFDLWADLLFEIGTDPVTWGSAGHMLYIGRKV
ncbi:MAG: class I SAM-dependent methyltransferase [Halanaerobiales bacterium]|nr:class I SAM-dependent methyltransferase [Halanaerobiales bacterium]